MAATVIISLSAANSRDSLMGVYDIPLQLVRKTIPDVLVNVFKNDFSSMAHFTATNWVTITREVGK